MFSFVVKGQESLHGGVVKKGTPWQSAPFEATKTQELV